MGGGFSGLLLLLCKWLILAIYWSKITCRMGTLIFLEYQKLKDSEKRSKEDEISCWTVCCVSTAKAFFRKVERKRGKEIDGHFTVLTFSSGTLFLVLLLRLSLAWWNKYIVYLLLEMGGIGYPEAGIEINSEEHGATPPTCVGVGKHKFVTQL